MIDRHYFSMQHILALVSLIYSAAYVIYAVVDGSYFVFISMIGTIVLGICSIIVLAKKDPDLFSAAGIMGIGFGAHMIFSFVADLGGDSIPRFIVGVIGVLTGLLTMMFSVPLYCGNRYDTKRILIVQGIYLAAYLLPIVIWVAFLGENFYELLRDYAPYILFFIPVVIYIIMIYKTDVGYRGTGSRSNSNIRMLTDALYSDQNTYAWRSDVKKIATGQWMIETKDKGHVVGESTLPLIMGGRKAYLVMQGWDDGRSYGMIVRHEDGTLIQTLRFEMCDVAADGDIDTSTSFTIYGREGFFIRILIKDEEVERNNSRLRKFLTLLVGANRTT